ncbi:MAG: alternative ribosome rescue aminoacyl-tRNA hydrolase ArfB [Cyclobacteriaceae bacterium]|nr:alternative ribosome rescue aminoacyl-tRNA hydrolase ArfB [Cyclobacteriaceae bacterium]
MLNPHIIKNLYREITFTFSRSSGPGGQHVNKVNTRVTLRFDVANTLLFDDREKALINSRMSRYISNEGIMTISNEEHRSQLKNKQGVMVKLERLLHGALRRKKTRIGTKPTKTAVLKRLNSKKHRAEKKQWRRKL